MWFDYFINMLVIYLCHRLDDYVYFKLRGCSAQNGVHKIGITEILPEYIYLHLLATISGARYPFEYIGHFIKQLQ